VVQLKAGAAASTGSQTVPTPDAGFVGIASVTVAQGATSVTAANIGALATAPRLSYTLPELRPGFSNSAAFTSVGVFSWVVPAGAFRARVRVKGGGGGGGGANSGLGGGGGGGGGYAEGFVAVTPGSAITITVGGGGGGGAIGAPGGAGTSSSFGSFLSATGGGGGAATGGAGGAGGVGTGGSTVNANGSGGGRYWPLPDGTVGGMGGSCYDTPHSQFPVGAAGLSGSGYGGGGSGGGSTSAPVYFPGGQGGVGAVFVEY
jgi:hypothetical protein